MSRVLVTGASGFVGRHLVEALVRRGDDVTCLVRQTSSTEHLRKLGVKLVYGDVTAPESLADAIAGQRIVYHVAGLLRAIESHELYRVNVQGAYHVAAACAACSTPPVLVHVSSLAAVGPAYQGRPRTETDPPAPVSHYGRSKLGGERAVAAFAHRVPITVVRPPMVIGESDLDTLPAFRLIDRYGVHLVPGLARHRYSLIHAADLAELLILAGERGCRIEGPPPSSRAGNDRRPARCSAGGGNARGYYFAACEEDYPAAELGRLIGQALGRPRVAVIPTAQPVVWVVAGTAELIGRLSGRPLVLHLDKAREMVAGSWTCSPRAAVEQLGFRVAAPLPERLRQTVAWYRREGWL